MVVIDALTLEFMKPRGAFYVLATVLIPFDIELGRLVVAQYFGGHEGADVEAHAVVQVGVPADGLFGELLPAHKDVVGWLAFKNEFQAALQVLRGGQTGLCAVNIILFCTG